MAEQSHTPGPWERGDGAANGCAGYIYCDDATGSAVATVVFSPDFFGRSEAETEANARLIAAAPELLEAAKAALEQLRASEDFKLRRGHQAAALERALAKATGGSV